MHRIKIIFYIFVIYKFYNIYVKICFSHCSLFFKASKILPEMIEGLCSGNSETQLAAAQRFRKILSEGESLKEN